MTKAECWMVVDENGNRAVGDDADEAWERYAELGETPCAVRAIKISLLVDFPPATELTATVPAMGGDVAMQVA